MYKMIRLNSYFVTLKNGSYIWVYAQSYEEYNDGSYQVYKFLIDGNLVSVIDTEIVKKIQISGDYEMVI